MGTSEGLGGCYKCMKYTLVAFNFIVLLIGIAVLGLGIYMVLTDVDVTKVTAILGSDLYKAGVYLLLAGGSVTILVSFCGCLGACIENRCLLGVYFAIMLILTIFFIAVCIIGFVFRNNIKGHLEREAETALINDYGSDKDFTTRWDNIQQKLKCCGMVGDANSNTSWAIFKLKTNWFTDQGTGSNGGLGVQYVPNSCCKPDGNQEVCVGRADAETPNPKPPKYGPPTDSTMGENEVLYTEGCYDKLKEFPEEYPLIIGGIALAALIIMLLGVIFSICLCTQIGRSGYVV